MERHFEDKFGPPPAYAPLPAHVVLVGQLVACAVLLALLQPPFVMAPPATADGAPCVCPTRVLAASAATAAATWALHACGAAPADTFRGACELLSRAAR